MNMNISGTNYNYSVSGVSNMSSSHSPFPTREAQEAYGQEWDQIQEKISEEIERKLWEQRHAIRSFEARHPLGTSSIRNRNITHIGIDAYYYPANKLDRKEKYLNEIEARRFLEEIKKDKNKMVLLARQVSNYVSKFLHPNATEGDKALAMRQIGMLVSEMKNLLSHATSYARDLAQLDLPPSVKGVMLKQARADIADMTLYLEETERKVKEAILINYLHNNNDDDRLKMISLGLEGWMEGPVDAYNNYYAYNRAGELVSPGVVGGMFDFFA
jgi:hypothetical protein